MKKRIDKRGKREDLEEVMKRNAICRKKCIKILVTKYLKREFGE